MKLTGELAEDFRVTRKGEGLDVAVKGLMDGLGEGMKEEATGVPMLSPDRIYAIVRKFNLIWNVVKGKLGDDGTELHEDGFSAFWVGRVDKMVGEVRSEYKD